MMLWVHPRETRALFWVCDRVAAILASHVESKMQNRIPWDDPYYHHCLSCAFATHAVMRAFETHAVMQFGVLVWVWVSMEFFVQF